MSIEATKRQIVEELFVRTADENYVTARWCQVNSLFLDFHWLAAHALEKYLKAVLLVNGHSSQGYQHDIVRLLKAVAGFADDLLPKVLTRPPKLGIYDWRDRTLEEFVETLARYGNPDNRYHIYGFVNQSQDLHMLDATVFAIRRLICPLDEPIFWQLPGGSKPITCRAYLKMQPDRADGMSMPLDQLIRDREPSDARHAALNLNFAFAPDRYEHTAIRSGMAATNPVIFEEVIFRLQHPDREAAKEGLEIAEWLLKNVKVPVSKIGPSVTQQLLDEMAVARHRHNLP